MIPGGYDWADDMLKVKSMRRRFRDNFGGDAINPNRWEVLATGSGMTLTVANGTAQISTGTTLDDELVLLSRQSFMLPLRAMVALNLSQRIAGQTSWLELVSITPETGLPDERNIVAWRLDGISATLANYEVGSDGAPRLGTASGVTIPTTAPAGWSVLELEPNSDECYFHGRALDGTGLRANSYARQQQLPDPAAVYRFRVRVRNRQLFHGISAVANNGGGMVRITRAAHGYLTAPFGWKASWDDIDIPALIAAANICDELIGTRAGVTERRYTVNGRVSLGEGKIAITRKLVAAMAGALVVSGGRFFIHAGGPALPAATLTSDDLRGDVTIQGSRPRRDLFNGVRAVYVDPAKNWQPTDAPPLLASNYVTEDGGEQIYRDMEFPLTTSVSTVQRLMKAELERIRRQREVAFPANLSALRLRPWDGVTVALDRVGPFPARVTGWRLSPDGGVDLTLSEEDQAVWDWSPAADERAAGDSPSVVLPNPGVIAAPAAIAVETPTGAIFAALGVSWAAVGSAYLAGYELEFRPASVATWQGYGGGLGATAASIPTTEPTAVRARAVARSGAVSGWREAAIPGTVAAPAALGITGGVRLSGGFPADAVRLQVFEATSASLAAAVKLATEPTALPWDRTGLTAGQARWYWLRAVSAEGVVSALVGPVTATAL